MIFFYLPINKKNADVNRGTCFMRAKKFALSLPIILSTVVLFSSCTKATTILPQQGLINNNITSFSTVTKKSSQIEMPIFNKKKLGNLVVASSINIQKTKQEKLHNYYFQFYSKGSGHYVLTTDKNEHIDMLLKAQSAIGKTLLVDADEDKRLTLTEILNFVTSTPYIEYFRKTYIEYSFNKLDKNADKKIVVDEFKVFNQVIKDPSLPDFQILETFSEYDYNSGRSLDIEEYEDFFMTYLLIKVGAQKNKK